MSMKGFLVSSIGVLFLIAGAVDKLGTTAQRVGTEPSVRLENGRPGTLPCHYERPVYVAYWYKGQVPSQSTLLVYLDVMYNNGERGGPAYTDGGRYNITSDFTLIIDEVEMGDAGHYICQVSDLGLGTVFRNYTNVTVVNRADPVGPIVINCLPTPSELGKCEYAMPVARGDEDVALELSCQVTGVKEPVDLFWYGSTGHRLIVSQQYNTTTYVTEEGGLYKVITVLQASEAKAGDEYECRASGMTVGRNESTITVSILAAGGETNPFDATIIYIIASSFFGIIVILTIVIVTYIRKRRRGTHHKPLYEYHPELEELQNDIKAYVPGQYMAADDKAGGKLPTRIYLAVFGVTNAGKSSLVRSLIYAFTGEFIPIEVAHDLTAGGVTTASQSFKVTDTVSLIDTPGLRDFGSSCTSDVIKQIRRYGSTSSNVIDCPIIAFDARNQVSALNRFFPEFAKVVKKEYGTDPPIVFTHKNEVRDPIQTITNHAKALGALESNLHFVENFIEKPSTDNDEEPCFEQRLHFLEILKELILLADKNMTFRLGKKEHQGRGHRGVDPGGTLGAVASPQ